MHAMARQRQAKPKQRDAMPQQAGAAQQRSDIATDLIAFAGRLKANVKEALTFCDTVIRRAKTGHSSAPKTGHHVGGTRWKNRLIRFCWQGA